MAIWVLIFFCFNLIMAGLHAEMIEKSKRIKHGLWGGGYVLTVFVLTYFVKSWELAVCLLVLRKWSFDIALNLFRGLSTFYVSSSPASIIDRFHNAVFGKKSEAYMVFYFIATILLTITIW